MVTPIIVLLSTGLIGDFGDDVCEEVQDLIFGHCVFQMRSSDAFGIPVFGFFGRLGDQGDHEEFQCLGYSHA